MMKIKSKFSYLFISIIFSLNIFANAQSFERNAKESTENFLKRICSGNSFTHYKILDSNINSPGKKIIFFEKKHARDSSINDSAKIPCMFVNILIPDSDASGKTAKKYSLQT